MVSSTGRNTIELSVFHHGIDSEENTTRDDGGGGVDRQDGTNKYMREVPEDGIHIFILRHDFDKKNIQIF